MFTYGDCSTEIVIIIGCGLGGAIDEEELPAYALIRIGLDL